MCLRVLLRGADAGDADVVRLMGKTMEEVVWYVRIESYLFVSWKEDEFRCRSR